MNMKKSAKDELEGIDAVYQKYFLEESGLEIY